MNKNDQEYLVQKIRTQYTEKEITELDELKALDKKVKRPANIFAYVFGILGALIMGSGMSLVMTNLGVMLGIKNTIPLGIITGIVGLIMVSINYYMYRCVLENRRKKYADEIIKLSDKIVNN